MTNRAQSTVDFPIGGHVNVLSDYKETGPENFFILTQSLHLSTSIFCSLFHFLWVVAWSFSREHFGEQNKSKLTPN